MAEIANSQVYFDSEYKVRILDPVKFEQSEALEKECGTFVEKIGSFNEKVHNLVEVLEQHATRIDNQKTRAIGLRMARVAEKNHLSRQERALKNLIAEKKAELDRYNYQLKSLEKIEGDQRIIIEKITNSTN